MAFRRTRRAVSRATAATLLISAVTVGTTVSAPRAFAAAGTSNAGPALRFPAPPRGEADVAYSDQLAVTGGTSPFAWSVSAGTLPAGITLNASTGVLAGTPTAGGTSNFTVKVTDATSETATDATSITVLAGALNIVQSANVATTTPGSPVGYTVKVTNTGQIALTGASFTNSLSGVLDDAGYNGDASATAGTVSFASPNLTWTGNLAIGASATITYSVKVTSPDTGNKVLASTITSTSAGSNCASGSADARCASTVTVLVPGRTPARTVPDLAPGLTIAVSAGSATTAPGAVVPYTVTVTDSGQTTYTGATFTDPLTGVLDDAAYNGDAAATAGTVSFASPNLTWTGDLAVGATATITFSVTVSNPDTGDDILASTVTSATPGSNCAAGSGAAACTATVTVAVLTIVDDSSASTTTPGSVVRFTATFTNAGQVPYTGITIASNTIDVLDDATPNGDQTATSGTLTLTATGNSWTGNIPVGGTVTVTGTVTVNDPDTGNDVLASTLATAASGSNCPAGGTDARCSVSVTVLTPALTIVKTADTSSAVPGQVISYTITVTDTGRTPYTDAAVTDSFAGTLDDAVYDGDAVATSGSVSYTSPTLTWTGGLAPGDSAVITYTVTVNNPDSGDKHIINTVTSTAAGSSCPPGTTAAACRVMVAVLTPALTIVKTATTTSGSNAVTTPGGVVTYAITVTNTGQIPYTGASFADSLTDVLDDAAYNGDASATAGTVSYASPILSWTGDLAVGAAATIRYTVTVNNPDTGSQTLTSTVTSATPGSNCPAGDGDARCTVTVTVAGADRLTFTQTADAGPTVAGGTVPYTITIVNSAAIPYNGASFTDPLADVLDDAAYDNDATATAGIVSYASPNLSWSGNVPANSTVTIRYSVTVNNPDTGDMILAATISSPSSGSNCPAASPGPQCTATVTVSQLAVTFAASAFTTTPDGIVQYTATLLNTGQTPYFGIAVNLDEAGIADDATGNGDATATSGTLIVGDTGDSWTGDIPVGGTVTITFTVTVNNPDTGDQIMTGTAVTTAPGSNCPADSADPACTAVTTVLTPALTIVKTADTSIAVPGQVIGYTVTITNSGQTSYTGATVTDSLAQMAGDAAYNGDAAATSGSLSYASPTLTWTGDLSPGNSAVFTYSVTVDNPDTDDKLVINSVSSTAAGSTCPPGATTTACRVTVSVLTPALTIAVTASPATATPGAIVSYTITVADTGQTPYTDATVTDPLADVLDDAAYNGDAAATAGSVSYASPNLTWTGDLAPGATDTITFTVTVNSPDTGDKTLTSTMTSDAAGNNCPADGTDPSCTATVAVVAGFISITTPASASLGSAAPGGTISGSLGTVQVTDNRGFGADWTATVATTTFTTGTGAPGESISAGQAEYDIIGLSRATGATFTYTPMTTLSTDPTAVVSATDVAGNNSATWNPLIQVSVPSDAIAGLYTATVTHSVS
jgi:large repetitive protein